MEIQNKLKYSLIKLKSFIKYERRNHLHFFIFNLIFILLFQLLCNVQLYSYSMPKIITHQIYWMTTGAPILFVGFISILYGVESLIKLSNNLNGEESKYIFATPLRGYHIVMAKLINLLLDFLIFILFYLLSDWITKFIFDYLGYYPIDTAYFPNDTPLSTHTLVNLYHFTLTIMFANMIGIYFLLTFFHSLIKSKKGLVIINIFLIIILIFINSTLFFDVFRYHLKDSHFIEFDQYVLGFSILFGLVSSYLIDHKMEYR